MRALVAMLGLMVAVPVVAQSVRPGLLVPVTVDMPTGDVRDVLRAVADAAGLSIVIPGELTGVVSMRVAGVPCREVFDTILRPRGYVYRVSFGGLVEITKEATKREVYPVRNRVVADLLPKIETMLAEGETVRAVSGGVVVDALASRQREIAQRIKDLDTERPRFVIECRFQEVGRQWADTSGIRWSALGGLGLSLAAEDIRIGNGSAALTAVLSVSEMTAVVSALETDAGSRVVARPMVAGVDGQPAAVSVGTQYPLPQYTFSGEQSVLQVSGFTYKDIGVILKVTPRAIGGDRVELSLAPEVSTVAATTSFAGAGAATLPVISTKSVQTMVELADGETVVLSGLTTTERTEDGAKVKGLGRVPVLGRLFRAKAAAENMSELVVFVTVRRLTGQGIEDGGDGQ